MNQSRILSLGIVKKIAMENLQDQMNSKGESAK